MVVVGDRNELDFGSHQGNQSAWFIDLQQFRALWDGKKPVFAVLGIGEFKQLQGTVTAPFHELARNSRKILITNR